LAGFAVGGSGLYWVLVNRIEDFVIMRQRQDKHAPPDYQNRLEQLRLAVGDGPLLILTHDNPDPDALAAGKTLAVLLEHAWKISSVMAYSGLVERAENRAMLRLLTPEWKPLETVGAWGQFSAIALVDTQPGAGNNNLPPELTPQIVIDHHHPLRSGLEKVRHVDIQIEVGSTVSIVYSYLEAAGIEPDARLATAVFYGIQTDTRGLTRGSSALDQHIYFKMLPRIDRELLIQVEQAGLPREYFRAFVSGLRAAKVYHQTVVSYLGEMHRPDFVAELADVLIRLENTQAVLCMGYHGATLYLSLRTSTPDRDAGSLLQRVILGLGRAGGHSVMAGGQVPLAERPPDVIAAEIERRFVALMDETEQTGNSLL
jgi:nanoRNase/pAp phosphatase (c-di-AMP/oligoRNAs hydrolase)